MSDFRTLLTCGVSCRAFFSAMGWMFPTSKTSLFIGVMLPVCFSRRFVILFSPCLCIFARTNSIYIISLDIGFNFSVRFAVSSQLRFLERYLVPSLMLSQDPVEAFERHLHLLNQQQSVSNHLIVQISIITIFG